MKLLLAQRKKMKRKEWACLRLISLLILLASLWRKEEGPVNAQSDTILWSKPINLSNTPSLSTHPAIITDDYGYVHVFWSEEMGGRARESGDLGGPGNSIFYTRWDGVIWTPPVDILFVPSEIVAEYIAVTLDANNILHAVWTGQTDFYYSNAASGEADSAHAWSSPVWVATDSARGGSESNIVADAAGNVHIIYATRGGGAGIYHIRSQDSGATWGLEHRLSLPPTALEDSFTNVRITVDGADRLHVTWQTNQKGGSGQALYYTHSLDAGHVWSSPTQIGYYDVADTFLGWAYLTVGGDSDLHLVYVDGSNKGRLHRTSLDGGATWRAPHYIIPEMEGVNGYVIPIVDNSGQMHLIVNMRTRAEQLVGVYYARWLESEWSRVIPLDNSSVAAPSAHYTAAAVRLGNEIHIVYNQISVGEIWHLSGTLPLVEPLARSELPQAQKLIPITPTLVAFTSTPEPALFVLGVILWSQTRFKT